MNDKDIIYENALKGKKIPVLTLDNKWHRLFTMTNKDSILTNLENDVNLLLKKQGRINTELKNIKSIKKKLMDEIVQLMAIHDEPSNKKIEENKKLIEECNEKMEEYEDELLDIPSRIDEANHHLMLRTMEICYNLLDNNTREIEKISSWISKIRVEIKKNVVRKQEREIRNYELYSFMHDIFGADVLEIFDMKYNPEDTVLRKKEENTSDSE